MPATVTSGATSAVLPFQSYGPPAGTCSTGPGSSALAVMNAQDALQAQQLNGLGGGGIKRRRQRKARVRRGGSENTGTDRGVVTVPSFYPVGSRQLGPLTPTSASVSVNTALMAGAVNVPGDNCATEACAPVAASEFPTMKGGRRAQSAARLSTRRRRRSSHARRTRRVATSGRRASSRRVASLRRYIKDRRRTLVALRRAQRSTIRDTNRALKSAERLGLTNMRAYGDAVRARNARWEATTRTGRDILTRRR